MPENENIKRVEDALVDFIVSETKDPSGGETISILPQMVHELIELWNQMSS